MKLGARHLDTVELVLAPLVATLLLILVVLGCRIVFDLSWLAVGTGLLLLVLAMLLFMGVCYAVRLARTRAARVALGRIRDSFRAQSDRRQSRDQVARLRAKWDRQFHGENGGLLRDKPLLMIVGESKSGKSWLLKKCGSDLVSGPSGWEGGTGNLDLWIFNEGAVIDTAGEMIDNDSDEPRPDWPALCGKMKAFRPRSPVNGVVFAVPAFRLKDSDEATRADKARRFQTQFRKLVETFGVRFPVSVVVTMADLIDGYREYALRQSAAHPGDKYTMLGWAERELLDEFGGGRSLDAAVERVAARIESQVLYDTCNPSRDASRDSLAIWCFPRSLRSVGQRLAEFLRIVFTDNPLDREANVPFFRGVFFGSAMQTVSRGEPGRGEAQIGESEPFNLRDLLKVRIFGETGLVTTSPRAELESRRRLLIGLGVPILVTAVAALVSLASVDLASRASKQAAGLQTLATALESKSASWIGDPDSHGELADALAAAGRPRSDFVLRLLLDPPDAGQQGVDVPDVFTLLVAKPLLESAARRESWTHYETKAVDGIGSLDQSLAKALRTLDPNCGRVWLEPTEQTVAPSSLLPLYKALRDSWTPETGLLLEIPEGWNPCGNVKQLAGEADEIRIKILKEKFEAWRKPLDEAANAYEAYLKPHSEENPQGGSAETQFASKVLKTYREWSGPVGKWQDLRRQLRTRDERTDLLPYMPNIDETTLKALQNLAVELQQHGPRDLGNLIKSMDLGMRRFSQHTPYEPGELNEILVLAVDRVQVLKPLLGPVSSRFDGGACEFVKKIKAHAVPEMQQPESSSRGALSPIVDLSHNRDRSLPERYEQDSKAIHSWLGQSSEAPCGDVTAVLAQLEASRKDAVERRAAWSLVRSPSSQGSSEDFVADLLRQAGGDAERSATLVATVRDEIAKQRAFRQGQGPPSSSAPLDEPRNTIAEALKAVSSTPSEDQGIRTAVLPAVQLLDEPNGQLPLEEVEYWKLVWRDLLVQAAEEHDRLHKEQVDRLTAVAKKFPLALTEQHGVVGPAKELQAVATYWREAVPQGSREVDVDRRGDCRLSELLNHSPSREPPEEAKKAVELLMTLVPAGVSEAATLELSWRWAPASNDLPQDIPAGLSPTVESLGDVWGVTHPLEINNTFWQRSYESTGTSANGGPLTWSGDLQKPDSVSVTFGSVNKETQKAQTLNGGPWASLQLALLLLPPSGNERLVAHENYHWGHIKVGELTAEQRKTPIYGALGLKLAWKNGETETPIDIGKWRDAFPRQVEQAGGSSTTESPPIPGPNE